MWKDESLLSTCQQNSRMQGGSFEKLRIQVLVVQAIHHSGVEAQSGGHKVHTMSSLPEPILSLFMWNFPSVSLSQELHVIRDRLCDTETPSHNRMVQSSESDTIRLPLGKLNPVAFKFQDTWTCSTQHRSKLGRGTPHRTP